MDTSQAPTDSSSDLSANQAAEAFSALLDPAEVIEKEKPVQTESDAEADVKAEAEPEAAPEDNETITVMVDGKPVELTKAQIAESHKNGLRQADYTKKTQEVAEERRYVEADRAKVTQERQQQAQFLQRNQVQLEAALQAQSQIDWHALREADPVEFLKQQHLYQDRQAALQKTNQQQQYLNHQQSADDAASRAAHLTIQRDELLAKIPEWKDPAKHAAGVAEVGKYLLDFGFDRVQVFGGKDANGRDIGGIEDHRLIAMAREAMLYRQMLDKAKTAAKKVANLPQRTERPSGGESQGIDRRSTAFQRLSKTGSREDAAAVFTSLLS